MVGFRGIVRYVSVNVYKNRVSGRVGFEGCGGSRGIGRGRVCC